MSTILKVDGRCPGCGSSTLYLDLDAGDQVLCHRTGCGDPDAAHRVLQDGETAHIVDFHVGYFEVLHPLAERRPATPGRDLFGCPIHRRLSALPGPPVPPGRYRVTLDVPTDELVYARVTA